MGSPGEFPLSNRERVAALVAHWATDATPEPMTTSGPAFEDMLAVNGLMGVRLPNGTIGEDKTWLGSTTYTQMEPDKSVALHVGITGHVLKRIMFGNGH